MSENSIKKLNAGIAFSTLVCIYEDEKLDEEKSELLKQLAKRMQNTEMGKEELESAKKFDQQAIEYAFSLIEEYLKEQGV